MKRLFILLSVLTGIVSFLYAAASNYYGRVFDEVPYLMNKGDFIGKTEEVRILKNRDGKVKSAVLTETFYLLTKRGKFYIGKVWAGSPSALNGKTIGKTESIMLVPNFVSLFKRDGGPLSEKETFRHTKY